MENEIKPVALTNLMVEKLDSISNDIKYYVNSHITIAQSLQDDNITTFNRMDDKEVAELLEIRERIKRLAYQLKNKLNRK